MIDRVEVDEKTLRALTRALRSEADGKELRRDLVTNLRAVAEPARDAARAALLSMPTHGSTETAPSLRTTVASRVVVQAAVSKGSVGVRAKRSGMPRGFANAPKRLNSRKGWRHQVFGTDRWVTQFGKPGWFDDTMRAFMPAAKRAAKEVMDSMARRIDSRTRG